MREEYASSYKEGRGSNEEVCWEGMSDLEEKEGEEDEEEVKEEEGEE